MLFFRKWFMMVYFKWSIEMIINCLLMVYFKYFLFDSITLLDFRLALKNSSRQLSKELFPDRLLPLSCPLKFRTLERLVIFCYWIYIFAILLRMPRGQIRIDPIVLNLIQSNCFAIPFEKGHLFFSILMYLLTSSYM